jgi:ribosomal protein L29
MKQGEIQELKNKPKEELVAMLTDMRKKLQDLTFDLLEGKVKNVKSVRDTKKTIARIETFLKQNRENGK